MDHHSQLAAFHALVLGPSFLYIGWAREKVPEWVLRGLGVIGLIVLFYHGYRYFMKDPEKSGWVNLIHIAAVAPLLIVIGYSGSQTPRRFFEMLLLLGFAAMGYHGSNLIRALM